MDYSLHIHYGGRKKGWDCVSRLFNAANTGIAEMTEFATHFPGRKWEIRAISKVKP